MHTDNTRNIMTEFLIDDAFLDDGLRTELVQSESVTINVGCNRVPDALRVLDSSSVLKLTVYDLKAGGNWSLPDAFSHLRELNISSINLHSIPKYMNKLESLRLAGNAPIEHLPLEMNAIEALTICQTKITVLPEIMPKLLILDISACNIRKLPSNMGNLQMLTADCVQITKIPLYPKLVILSCCYTSITEIPRGLTKLKSLKCIANGVSEIPDDLLDLETLDCRTLAAPGTPLHFVASVCQIDNVINKIKRIPDTLIKLGKIKCDSDTVLPSWKPHINVDVSKERVELSELLSSNGFIQPPKKTLECYDDVHRECRNLLMKKNADYGDSFRDFGAIGVLMRIGDKLSRMKTVTKNKVTLVDDESLRDTLLDLHKYSALAISLLDEE